MKNNTIKIILAVALLICLFQMPYGYYQFVRFISMIGFGYLAYNSNHSKKETEVIIFAGLAILFQPFFKIALGRNMWNIVDLVVAIGLIISVIKSKKGFYF